MNIFHSGKDNYSSAIRRQIIVSLISLLAFWLFISLSPFYLTWEQATGLQWLFKMRGAKDAPENVNIVAINSRAAAALGLPQNSPSWSRRVYANVVQKLNQSNARLIVIDINFKEARSEEEDKALETAIEAGSNVILITYLKRQQIDTGDGFIDIEEAIPPIERFARPAAGTGPFTLPKFPARVASTELYAELTEGIVAAQPLTALLALHQKELAEIVKAEKLTAPNEKNLFEWVKLSSRQLSQYPELSTFYRAATQFSPIYINYYGPDRSIATRDIDWVLNAPLSETKAQFQNKIVYLGFSDPAQTEQKDAYRTVFTSARGVDLSGVEISATVFSNLVDQSFIQAPATFLKIAIVITALFASSFAALRWHYSLSMTIQVAILSVYLFVAAKLFNTYYIWLPLLLPLLIVCSQNIVIGLVRYRQQKSKVQRIENAIRHYLPGEAAHQLSQSIVNLENRHQLVNGVCLMSDIRGYTRLAENTDPQELHQLMNRYYPILLKEVKERGGIIGNIVGDSMLALWTGAEVSESMCEQALSAAIAIQKNLTKAKLDKTLPTGFALHGGQFSLGNLGAQEHFEYSPVGDIINTTSRIEPMNRKLDTKLLCSHLVYKLLANSSYQKQFRYVGQFDMHNKASSFELFAFEGMQDAVDLLPDGLQSLFAEAIASFEDEKTDHALQLFGSVLDKSPNHGPSRYYKNLIQNRI